MKRERKKRSEGFGENSEPGERRHSPAQKSRRSTEFMREAQKSRRGTKIEKEHKFLESIQ